MKNYRYIAATLYISLVVAGLLLNQIQFWILLPFTICMIVGHVLARRSAEAEKSYFYHLRKTSAICIGFFAINFLLLFVGIYIDFQLGLLLPDHQIIEDYPGQFMLLANNLKYFFGLLCIGILGFLAVRSYQCLMAIMKRKPI